DVARSLAYCASPDTWIILILYTLSGFIITSSYFSTIAQEEPITNMFERPSGHYIDVRQLNQKNIFIVLYVVTLSTKYVASYLNGKRHILKIDRVQQSLFYEMKGNLITIFRSSAKEALVAFFACYIAFIIFSGNIYYYVAHAVGLFDRVLDSPIVGFRWVDLCLFARIVMAGSMTATIWNYVNCLFNATYASTTYTTDPYTNQFDCIITGLAQKDNEMIQASAFNELALLASKSPQKRTELFALIGKEPRQSAWYRIMTHCIRVIGDLRMSINTEYKGVEPVKVPTAPMAKPLEQQLRNRLQFEDDSNIYCAQKQQVREFDDRTSSLFGQVDELMESAPSPGDSPAVQQVKNDALVRMNKVVSFVKNLEVKFGYKGYCEKFYQESRVFEVQRVFKKYQLTMWAIQILGSLVACSVKEDVYGCVQNDISTVLNELLGCYEDVEKYVQKETVQIEEVEAVKKTLEEAVLQIVIAFNDYLHVFNIENRYSHVWKKWSSFQ
ncbi:Nucleoporin NDC1, partial [Rhizopus stolonifer]